MEKICALFHKVLMVAASKLDSVNSGVNCVNLLQACPNRDVVH